MKKILFGLAFIMVLFIFIEILIRIVFGYFILNFDIEMVKYIKNISIADLKTGHRQKPMVSEKIMGADIAINELGLRSGNVGYNKTDEKRILALGDSMIFGWGVQYEKTFIYLLQKKLEQCGKYEIINSGHPNYNMEKYFAFLDSEGLKYKPDYVVVFYYINDVEEYKPLKDNPFISWSNAFTFFYTSAKKIYMIKKKKNDSENFYRRLYKEDSVEWIACQNNMDKIILKCREYTMPVIFVILPELRNVGSYQYGYVNKMVKDFLSSRNVVCFDLLDSVKNQDSKKLWVGNGDIHPNEFCSKLYADALYEFMLKYLNENHAN